MTIAMGFRCQDGVALFADSQLTADSGYKYQEPKIVVIQRNGTVVAMAYTGYPRPWKEAIKKIGDSIFELDVRDASAKSTREAIQSALKSMGRLDSKSRWLQILIAIKVKSEPADLFLFDGRAIEGAEDFNCVGVGDSALIRYFQASMLRPFIRAEQAVFLGAYFAKQAKEYIPGCGGKTDIVVIWNSGKCDWVDAAEVRNIEAGLGICEKAALGSFMSTLDRLPTLSERQNRKKVAEEMAKKLKNPRA